jgi:predicted  nucleic acid-binding Zn-ribbon protein
MLRALGGRWVLNDILDHTFQEAKKKLVRRSPELEELIKEVKRWVIEIDEEREKKQRQGKEKP